MGKVITVNGYRAFIGTMKIRLEGFPEEEIYGQWLYRPDTGCWYCAGHTYTWSMCTIVSVE